MFYISQENIRKKNKTLSHYYMGPIRNQINQKKISTYILEQKWEILYIFINFKDSSTL